MPRLDVVRPYILSEYVPKGMVLHPYFFEILKKGIDSKVAPKNTSRYLKILAIAVTIITVRISILQSLFCRKETV